jgi:hypothetical protein
MAKTQLVFGLRRPSENEFMISVVSIPFPNWNLCQNRAGALPRHSRVICKSPRQFGYIWLDIDAWRLSNPSKSPSCQQYYSKIGRRFTFDNAYNPSMTITVGRGTYLAVQRLEEFTG